MLPKYEDTQEESFTAVLDALFHDEQIPLAKLHRLSDLAGDAMTQFQARWADVPPLRRQQLVRHLADLTEDNFVVDFTAVFTHLLTDDLPDVRIAALDGMWDCTNTRVIRPIIGLLQSDPDAGVRAAAAAALAHFVLMAEWGQLPKRILPRINEALLAVVDQPETAVAIKRAALEALGSSSHDRVPALIEAAYHDADADLQLSAVFAMGASADRRWLPIILAEMTSSRMEMRAEAARAAGIIGSSDALENLRQMVQEDDEDVAVVAIRSLGMIGGEMAAEIIQNVLDDPQAEYLHPTAAEALEEINWLNDDIMLDALDYDEDDDMM